MKFKLITVFTTLSVLGLLLSVRAFAATLTLTKIGALDTTGKTYTEWWYTGVNPLMKGTAEKNADVSIKAGDKTFTGSADVSGLWSIAVILEKGDYPITITSDDASYSFTLHLGQQMGTSTSTSTTTTTSDTSAPAQSTSSQPATPDTGSNQTSAVFFGIGISLLAGYLYFSETQKRHKNFEKNIISDR